MRRFISGMNPDGSKHYIYNLNKKPWVTIWQLETLTYRKDIKFPLSIQIDGSLIPIHNPMHLSYFLLGFRNGWERSMEYRLKKGVKLESK